MKPLGIRWRAVRLACVVLCVAPAAAYAQQSASVTADFLFYGDNTEFANPFREGETLLGNTGTIAIGADVADRATITGGIFADRRFGDKAAFDLVRPVFSLDFRAGSSRFTFGTLSLRPQPAFGPDRGGPHGLLPPIQRETLSLTRPYEAGLEWRAHTARVEHDFWIDWQRLNTPAGREIFDVGTIGSVSVGRDVALAYQSHIVHHGGQLYSTGAVSDSWVIAPGLTVGRNGRAPLHASAEAYVLISSWVPDREAAARTAGAAAFARGAIERGGWRGHLIVWRGNDYIKEEGDANYGGLRRDGARFRKVRDYSELGLTRIGHPVPQLQLEGSARLHRVENHYEYSYRILGRMTMRWRIK